MAISIDNITIKSVPVAVVREDLNHPVIQGNKLRKLKYNLLEAGHQKATSILTFGGAYSNHLLATACAAQEAGFNSVGVVRGDELASQKDRWSDTLLSAQKYGMKLCFVSRTDYRLKEKAPQVQAVLKQAKSQYFVVPEGGSNSLAVQGVAEMVGTLWQQGERPSHIFCPVGTGGTLAGVINGIGQHTKQCKVFGTIVLKGLHGVKQEIKQWLIQSSSAVDWQLLEDYHFGGYAKSTTELKQFAIEFEQKYQIPLDKIYNAKSFFALCDLINQGQITEEDRPMIIHTGGLQGGTFGDMNEK